MQLEVSDVVLPYVYNALAAQFPGIPISVENAPFDWNNRPQQFVEVELEFYDGAQIGMAYRPKSRLSGCLYLTVHTREGLGSRSAKVILDWFSRLMQYQSIGGANFQAIDPDPTQNLGGYEMRTVKVPFFTDPT